MAPAGCDAQDTEVRHLVIGSPEPPPAIASDAPVPARVRCPRNY